MAEVEEEIQREASYPVDPNLLRGRLHQSEGGQEMDLAEVEEPCCVTVWEAGVEEAVVMTSKRSVVEEETRWGAGPGDNGLCYPWLLPPKGAPAASMNLKASLCDLRR